MAIATVVVTRATPFEIHTQRRLLTASRAECEGLIPSDPGPNFYVATPRYEKHLADLRAAQIGSQAWLSW